MKVENLYLHVKVQNLGPEVEPETQSHPIKLENPEANQGLVAKAKDQLPEVEVENPGLRVKVESLGVKVEDLGPEVLVGPVC